MSGPGRRALAGSSSETLPDWVVMVRRPPLVLNGAEDAYRIGLFAALIVPTGNVDEAVWSAAAPCR
jgi:hypothetical protein